MQALQLLDETERIDRVGLKYRSILNRLTSNKSKSLIINPGPLTDELLKEDAYALRYKTRVWDELAEPDLERYIRRLKFDVVLIDPSGKNVLSNLQLGHLSKLKVLNNKVYNLVSFYETSTLRVPLAQLPDEWVVNTDVFYAYSDSRLLVLKRLFDLTLSILILPIAFLLIVFGCILIKLTSKGPALFIQDRVGRQGKSFKIYKLRTMRSNSSASQFTIKNDSRITPVGNFLRKTKIDELPQLFNIIRGEMSLVGPRPEKVDIVEKISEENPYYALRHLIRPGVTGWAQVNHPTASPLQNLQKLEYDLYYIKNLSPYLDLKIIWKTIKVIATLDSL